MLQLDTGQHTVVFDKANDTFKFHLGIIIHLEERQIWHILINIAAYIWRSLAADCSAVQEALLWKLAVAYL